MADAAPGREGDDPADGGAGPGRERVALDANALLSPVRDDLRLFEELDRVVGEVDPVVPRAVVAELEGLSADGGRTGVAAGVGLELTDRCRVVDTGAGDGDDALVELARTGRVAYVATVDRDLADRVLALDVPVIGLRGGHQLAVTRP